MLLCSRGWLSCKLRLCFELIKSDYVVKLAIYYQNEFWIFSSWTEEEALSYMKKSSPYTDSGALAEIKRYITWPGQVSELLCSLFKKVIELPFILIIFKDTVRIFTRPAMSINLLVFILCHRRNPIFGWLHCMSELYVKWLGFVMINDFLTKTLQEKSLPQSYVTPDIKYMHYMFIKRPTGYITWWIQINTGEEAF